MMSQKKEFLLGTINISVFFFSHTPGCFINLFNYM